MDQLDIDPILEVLHCFSEDGIVHEFKEGLLKLPREMDWKSRSLNSWVDEEDVNNV
jgi:hypothetical protein